MGRDRSGLYQLDVEPSSQHSREYVEETLEVESWFAGVYFLLVNLTKNVHYVHNSLR